LPEVLTQELYMSGFPSVRKFLEITNWDSGIVGYCNVYLTDTVMTTFKFAADHLARNSDGETVPEDILKALKTDISDLSDKVLKREMPKKLKSLLLDLLESAVRAITEYRFRGKTGLRQETYLIAEKVQRHADELRGNKSDEDVSALWKLLERLELLSSLISNAPQLFAASKTLLG
jgi:hypothetical protein